MWNPWARHKKDGEDLEKARVGAIARISEVRSGLDSIVCRPRKEDDKLDSACLEKLLESLTKLEKRVQAAATESEIDDLDDEVSRQERLSAYLLPMHEVKFEGERTFALMEWWGIPTSEIKGLRSILGESLKQEGANSLAARAALHHLFEERDDWDSYREDYEEAMEKHARRMFYFALCSAILAGLIFYLCHFCGPLVALGILSGGVTGGCVSVLTKLPLIDRSEKEKIDSYARQIYSRVGAGAIASVIGCGLLGWGVINISIGGLNFNAILLDTCTAASPPNGIGLCLSILVLLSVSILLGFSERALNSFEESIFGKAVRPIRPREK